MVTYLISVFTFSCWLTCLVQCFDAVRPSRSVVKMQTSPARHLYVTLRLFTSRTAIAWRRCYCFHWRPFVCLLCVRVCQHDNCWTVWDIAMKFLREQYVVRSSDQFEHGAFRCTAARRPGGDLTSLMFQFISTIWWLLAKSQQSYKHVEWRYNICLYVKWRWQFSSSV